MTDLAFQPAILLAAALRERRVGAEELLDLCLARVARHNPQLNAIVCMDVEGARKRAQAADAATARGESWGPLHGVPVTVKESFNVAGLPTTWGVPAMRGNIAESNALAVERLLGAGAVLFGKSNVPINLADWQSYNEIYGTTNNPWDPTRTPGGSSGGAAAALAAGMTGLEMGSDIGASIRNPAHYCGVFGHKPTWNICPMRGHGLPGGYIETDISAIGPLARGTDDLELLLGIIAGPDPIHGPGPRLDLAPPRRESLRDFRVAVMLTDPNCAQDDELTAILQGLVDGIARAGATVSDKARPDIDTRQAHALYVKLLRAATSARLPDEALAAQIDAAARLAPGDESYYARMIRANTLRHRDWLQADNERQRVRRVWAEFFREWDVLLCPVAASAAFPHDHVGERQDRTIPVNGRPEPTTDQLFWAGLGGMVYLPGTVAPAGRTRAGLPVGIQIVAPHLEDRTGLQMSRLIEREFGGFVPPPGFEG